MCIVFGAVISKSGDNSLFKTKLESHRDIKHLFNPKHTSCFIVVNRSSSHPKNSKH